ATRRSTQLEKAQRALRAAQYVRMSTDFQRYSIQNQAAAIAAYAQQRNLTIVRTYLDEGRSGLRINGRPGLIELLEDVQSGHADFDHILVYDVSRWGRFQDVDERKSYSQITRELNRAKITNQGRPWTGSMIRIILLNENYIGNIVYNRTTRSLGQKQMSNPQERWVRGLAAIAPIVDPSIF